MKYIRNLYSSLSGYVSTKSWTTFAFKIKRGVFQGDTLSPILFLIAFHPIIASISCHPSRGFFLQLDGTQNVTQASIPAQGKFIYAYWDEANSDEKEGWYLAKITSVCESGVVTLLYKSTKTQESVRLSDVKWVHAKGNGEWYLPPDAAALGKISNHRKASKEHKVKGFADDLTVISSTKEDHQNILSCIDSRCEDISLSIRPDKCHSLVFNGQKAVKKTSFLIGSGETQNICDHPTLFLGSTIGCNTTTSVKSASNSFSSMFISSLEKLDQAKIRGEYKVWIYKRYLVHAMHYKLAVNMIKKSVIRKCNALATKLVKKWLGLTRSTTVAVLHHPSVLDIPFLDDFSTKAKLTFLSAATISRDPLIEEIASIALSDNMQSVLSSSKSARDVLNLAIESVESIDRRTFPRVVKHIMKEKSVEKWKAHLSNLTVQKKFNESCELEEDNRVWNRLLGGLPAGQLSFILRAASDTLPTPLNLKRWRIRIDSKCPLCECSFPTSFHILNGCSVALDQERYTWRHDSVLLKLVQGLRGLLPAEFCLYSDLDGYRASDNPPATIPPGIVVTTARPDIFIRHNNTILLVELTVSHNSKDSLNDAHRRKSEKVNYCSLLGDLEVLGLNATLIPLEIGSLGHWLQRSCETLAKHLPSAAKSRLKKILDEAARVAIAASHHIFLARQDQNWQKNKPLIG